MRCRLAADWDYGMTDGFLAGDMGQPESWWSSALMMLSPRLQYRSGRSTSCKVAWQKNLMACECWRTADWPRAKNLPSKQRWPTASWMAGRCSHKVNSPMCSQCWNNVSSAATTRMRTKSYRGKSNEETWGLSLDWSMWHTGRHWESWNYFEPGKERAQWDLNNLHKYLMETVKRVDTLLSSILWKESRQRGQKSNTWNSFQILKVLLLLLLLWVVKC